MATDDDHGSLSEEAAAQARATMVDGPDDYEPLSEPASDLGVQPEPVQVLGPVVPDPLVPMLTERSFTRLQRVILWAGGADISILRTIGVEFTEFNVQGTGVLFTAAIAAVAGFLSSGAIFDPPPPWPSRLLVSLAFAAAIFTVDRMVVRSNLRPYHFDGAPSSNDTDLPRQPLWWRIQSALTLPLKVSFRFAIALIISYLIADLIGITIFKDRVQQQVSEMNQERYDGLKAQYDAELKSHTDFTNDKNQQITILREQLSQLINQTPEPSADYKRDQVVLDNAIANVALQGQLLKYYTKVSETFTKCAQAVPSHTLIHMDSPPGGSNEPVLDNCDTSLLSNKQRFVDQAAAYADLAKNQPAQIAKAKNQKDKAGATVNADIAQEGQRSKDDPRLKTLQNQIDGYTKEIAADDQRWADTSKELSKGLSDASGATVGHDLLTWEQALNRVADDMDPGTPAVEKAPDCQGSGIAKVACGVWRFFSPPTPGGAVIGLIRGGLLLIDLSPMFMKIVSSMRRRRAYDFVVARLEHFSMQMRNTALNKQTAIATVTKQAQESKHRYRQTADVGVYMNRVDLRSAAERSVDELRVQLWMSAEKDGLYDQYGPFGPGARNGQVDGRAGGEARPGGGRFYGGVASPAPPSRPDPGPAGDKSDPRLMEWDPGRPAPSFGTMPGVPAPGGSPNGQSNGHAGPNGGRRTARPSNGAASVPPPGWAVLQGDRAWIYELTPFQRNGQDERARSLHRAREIGPNADPRGFVVKLLASQPRYELIAGLLDSPYLVRYEDTGFDQEAAGYWITMLEYPNGSVAEQYILGDRDGTVGTVLDMARDCLAGLVELNARLHFTHRDIKPANILISNDFRQFVLCDYGLARPIDKETFTSFPELSPYYAPLDQLSTAPGVPYSSLVDIRALGATMYTLFTGLPPLWRESRGRGGGPSRSTPVLQPHPMTVFKMLGDGVEPAPILTIDPRLPPEVSALVSRWLANERTSRVDATDSSNHAVLLSAVTALEAVSRTAARNVPIMPRQLGNRDQA